MSTDGMGSVGEKAIRNSLSQGKTKEYVRVVEALAGKVNGAGRVM